VSPQYRFFFPFILILSLLILSAFIYKQKTIKIIIGFGLVMTAMSLFFSMNVSKLTEDNMQEATHTFKVDYVIKPHSNSQFETGYEVLNIESISINAPTAIDFFWGTGDLPLPSVNKQQLEYFKTYFNIIPQQRTEDVKDGFYSKALEND
jgi:hypothetical protein